MTLKILPRSKSKGGLAYHKTGPKTDKPPLIFIHGVGLRAESWGAQIEYFKSRFTVYAIDLPGHGESDGLAMAEPSVSTYRQKLENFITDEAIGPSFLCGHSLGALIALDLAVHSPRPCAGVAAISTIFQRSDEASIAVKARAKFIRDNPKLDLATSPLQRWFEDQNSQEARLCRSMIESNSPAGYAAAYNAFANSRGPHKADVEQIDMPLLFLTGEDDFNSTSLMSNDLAALSHGSRAAIIKEARHMVLLTHAKETNAALDAYFKKAQDKSK